MEIFEIEGLKFHVRTSRDKDVITGEILKDPYRLIQNKCKFLVDIGGHIGGTAIYCASKGATVQVYEPLKVNYDLLIENIKLNNLEDKITAFRKAISNTNSQTKLYLHEWDNASTSLYKNNSGGLTDKYEIVETITIKEVFRNIQHCDYLKIDCEGGEYDFIPYIGKKLVQKIDKISMELHLIHGKNDKKIFEHLNKFYQTGIKRYPQNHAYLVYCYQKRC